MWFGYRLTSDWSLSFCVYLHLLTLPHLARFGPPVQQHMFLRVL